MIRPRIAVLDYDAGNLRSAAKALERAGAVADVVDDPAGAAPADGLFVPGVGHFGQCVAAFRARGFDRLVADWQAADRPVLGVCVGMQILYASSEEAPDVAGLGVLPGRTVRLPDRVTVPHMGWNRLTVVADDPLVAGLDGAQVYFVHSYYAEPDDPAHVVATCPYGPSFPAVVRVGSVAATQFHPEKSAAVGGRLLEHWLAEVVRVARDGGRAAS